jgi:hypothetical protein
LFNEWKNSKQQEIDISELLHQKVGRKFVQDFLETEKGTSICTVKDAEQDV